MAESLKVDTIAQAIADVRAGRAQIQKGDPYGAKLGGLVDTAASAAEAVRSFLWGVRDRFEDAWLARSQALGAALAATSERAPAYGFDSPQGRSASIAGAQRQQSTDAQRSTATAVLTDRTQSRAGELAQSFVDAMRALVVGVDSALSDYSGPGSMRVTNDLGRMQTIASTQKEIEAWSWPAKRAVDLFKGYVDRGEDEKAAVFMEAARPVMISIRDTPQPKLAARYTLDGSGVDVSEERNAAWRLLDYFDHYSRAKRPESISIADQCRAGLVGVFSELVGVSPQFMSPGRFATTYLNAPAKPQPWQIDPGFVLRRLPPNDSPLPGWTPGRAMPLGTIVRGRR